MSDFKKIVMRLISIMMIIIFCFSAKSVYATEDFSDRITIVEGTVDDRYNVMLGNPLIESDILMNSGWKSVWDCVWFGNYPQTEIVQEGSKEEQALKKMNTYFRTEYESVSENEFNAIKNASYDINGDTVLNGVRYRRIDGGDTIYYSSGGLNHYDWNYRSTTYHYFRYEPIKWRILRCDEKEAFLMADVVLDTQRYYPNSEDVTWGTSTIRSWLNGYGSGSNKKGIDYSGNNFIDTAFTSEEQKAIKTMSVTNSDNTSYGTDGGINTNDKIYLLSESEAYGANKALTYGFVENRSKYDEGREADSSTYAYAMGVYRSTEDDNAGKCNWWLRSPGSNAKKAANIDDNGWGNNSGDDVHHNEDGVRPILYLNYTTTNLFSKAGTVCSDGTVEEEVPGGNDETENTEQNAVNAISSNSGNKVINKKVDVGNTLSASKEKNTLRKKGRLKKVSSPKKRTIKIKWKKMKGITGYQIYVSRKKDFSRKTIQRYLKKKKSSATLSFLKSKKIYYVKMRPYKKSGKNKIYGTWSKVKKVKIK